MNRALMAVGTIFTQSCVNVVQTSPQDEIHNIPDTDLDQVAAGLKRDGYQFDRSSSGDTITITSLPESTKG